MCICLQLVTPAGLEPATLCFEGRCSIQLSYGALVSRPPKRRAYNCVRILARLPDLFD